MRGNATDRAKSKADTALFNSIISGQIRHYRSQDLDEAVRNTIIIETQAPGLGWRRKRQAVR